MRRIRQGACCQAPRPETERYEITGVLTWRAAARLHDVSICRPSGPKAVELVQYAIRRPSGENRGRLPSSAMRRAGITPSPPSVGMARCPAVVIGTEHDLRSVTGKAWFMIIGTVRCQPKPVPRQRRVAAISPDRAGPPYRRRKPRAADHQLERCPAIDELARVPDDPPQNRRRRHRNAHLAAIEARSR